MPFNTLTVGAAVTPYVIETYFSHYLHRAPLHQKPTAHISYHEGLQLIKHFLEYASRHTVEDIQGFTAQHVPSPHWIRLEETEIGSVYLDRAATLLQEHLGTKGLDRIGGKTWWQWRRPKSPLQAEWIEMKKDYNARKRAGVQCERVMMYIHGGAYYFGSVDEHRYQMQRHARKLKAKVLAPRYRLAPQFPFPCGLQDCIATYFYLLEHFDPSQVIIAGDSAGAGMALSLLCILRDQNMALPAGSILLSPWVDLTHSFPSIAGESDLDYIPSFGFHHRPSMAWPPATNPSTSEKLDDIASQETEDANALDRETNARRIETNASVISSKIPLTGHNLTIHLDGKLVELRDQVQMYAPNELLAHPLVSPVMQPSLGGLPPILIQTGGGELLRDEQIYIAHKAANPQKYPVSETIRREYAAEGRSYRDYPPTNVQLQVWEDLCHVTHALSFTRPAKYMYRSVAQFGAWALAHAQQKGIDIQNDDAISVISSGEEDHKEDENGEADGLSKKEVGFHSQPQQLSVGRAGDPLPRFKDHMIRQRVTRHGIIYPLAPVSEIECLSMDPGSIGAIKPGPVRKWLKARQAHDVKFANEWKKVQLKREKEMLAGYEDFPGEHPPPSALAGRRRTGMASEEKKRGKGWGLAMWSGWGSNHDEQTLEREEQAEQTFRPAQDDDSAIDDTISEAKHPNLLGGEQESNNGRRKSSVSRVSQNLFRNKTKEEPRSPYEEVRDEGQANGQTDYGFGVSDPAASKDGEANPLLLSNSQSAAAEGMSIPTMAVIAPDSEKIADTDNTFLGPSSTRPHNGTVAYPFKLKADGRSASTVTLESVAKIAPMSSTASEQE